MMADAVPVPDGSFTGCEHWAGDPLLVLLAVKLVYGTTEHLL